MTLEPGDKVPKGNVSGKVPKPRVDELRDLPRPRVISAHAVETGFDVYQACVCCGALWRPDQTPFKHRTHCLYLAYERKVQESDALRDRWHHVVLQVQALAKLVRQRP